MSNKTAHIKVVISGGGTGGHIFPAVSIAHALKRLQQDVQILFVGAKGKMEMEKVPREGFEIVGLDIAGMNRNALWKNIFLPFKIIKSLIQASNLLNKMKPDIAIGVGGYASFPLLYMAQRKNIPTVIQEQNSFAGKSNQILGKKANAICVAYDAMERFFPKNKIIKTGNPVRKHIVSSHVSREESLQFFQLENNKKVIFVFGGSLGAKNINEAILAGFKNLLQADVQLIWQTGKMYFEKAKDAIKGFESKIKVYEFLYEMDKAYAVSDIIVSRAGASSIAELCIVAKPVIFVPFPFASEDHQTHNAMALVQKNAAMMVSDALAVNELIPKVLHLINNTSMCNMMSSKLQEMAITNADDIIAKKILEIVNKKNGIE